MVPIYIYTWYNTSRGKIERARQEKIGQDSDGQDSDGQDSDFEIFRFSEFQDFQNYFCHFVFLFCAIFKF
jgi:hypothetical protein